MRPKLRERITIREEKWGAIVCDRALGVLYELNEDGYRVLTLCNGRRTIEDIVDILSNEYETSPCLIEPIAKKYLDALL